MLLARAPHLVLDCLAAIAVVPGCGNAITASDTATDTGTTGTTGASTDSTLTTSDTTGASATGDTEDIAADSPLVAVNTEAGERTPIGPSLGIRVMGAAMNDDGEL